MHTTVMISVHRYESLLLFGCFLFVCFIVSHLSKLMTGSFSQLDGSFHPALRQLFYKVPANLLFIFTSKATGAKPKPPDCRCQMNFGSP